MELFLIYFYYFLNFFFFCLYSIKDCKKIFIVLIFNKDYFKSIKINKKEDYHYLDFIHLQIISTRAILDKKYPHFLFMFRMSIKQIIEGIIVVLICIIPNYEKKEKEKETGKKQKIE